MSPCPKKQPFLQTRSGRNDIFMFRFDDLRQANTPIKFLDVEEGKPPLIVCMVGDSLHGPFWPRGTGANHSIMASLILARQLKKYFKDKKTKDEKECRAAAIRNITAQCKCITAPTAKIDDIMGVKTNCFDILNSFAGKSTNSAF